PKATVIGCTTAGEISNKGVSDNSTVVTAAHFNSAHMKSTSIKLTGADHCQETGKQIGEYLKAQDLKAVFVLGQGIN
ncbi:FIST N-terminal domain-containing protein, partial [Lysinibacillus sp. VIII_CA]|uniref:FIST N-terminal domain-containing protein n=1 Tax=Lysinibacillus sp. VIII_CA TaxID=3417452 RepID=UPI003CF5E02E